MGLCYANGYRWFIFRGVFVTNFHAMDGVSCELNLNMEVRRAHG